MVSVLVSTSYGLFSVKIMRYGLYSYGDLDLYYVMFNGFRYAVSLAVCGYL